MSRVGHLHIKVESNSQEHETSQQDEQTIVTLVKALNQVVEKVSLFHEKVELRQSTIEEGITAVKNNQLQALGDIDKLQQNLHSIINESLKRHRMELLRDKNELKNDINQVQQVVAELQTSQNTLLNSYSNPEHSNGFIHENQEIDTLDQDFAWLLNYNQIMNLAFDLVDIDPETINQRVSKIAFLSKDQGSYVIFRDTRAGKYYLLPTQEKRFNHYNLQTVRQFFSISFQRNVEKSGEFQVARPVEVSLDNTGRRWQVLKQGELLIFENGVKN
jgi:hypothetical protein